MLCFVSVVGISRRATKLSIMVRRAAFIVQFATRMQQGASNGISLLLLVLAGLVLNVTGAAVVQGACIALHCVGRLSVFLTGAEPQHNGTPFQDSISLWSLVALFRPVRALFGVFWGAGSATAHVLCAGLPLCWVVQCAAALA